MKSSSENTATASFVPRLGFSLHLLRGPNSPQYWSELEQSGISTFELRPELFKDPDQPDFRRRYVEMIERSGKRTASIHAPFGGACDISSLDREIRAVGIKSLKAAIDLAAELGAPIVVLHASAEPVLPQERRERLGVAFDSLTELTGDLSGKGIKLAVELLPRSCLGNRAAELQELVEPLPTEYVGYCLDTNHMMERTGELAAKARRLAPRLLNLHISDYDGVDEKHWLPGEGVNDWVAFLRVLAEIGYRGPFNFETKLPEGTVAEQLRALEASYDWLRTQIP